MTISKDWSVFFVAAALVVSRVWGDFGFSLSPESIQPGQRAVLTLRLPEKDLIRPPTNDEDLPVADDEALLHIKGLELLGQDYKKENGAYVWTYEFTSYDLGEFAIPPISVRVGPQSFSSERTTLITRTTRAEGDLEIRPDGNAVAVPWNWKLWFGLFALGLVAFFAWKPVRRWITAYRNRPRPIVVEAPPVESPVDWLRRQFALLRVRAETSMTDPKGPDAWSLVVRGFALRSKGVPVTAWTTREARHRLYADPKWMQVSDLLDQCDRFKFSPEDRRVPPGQLTLRWIEESERILL